jgi:lipoate-protein ligase A
VIPRGFAFEELRATESYRRVHECLATALREQGVPAVVKTHCEPPAEGEVACGPAGVCFQRAELYDVVHGDTGEKIAGAAQKRNKRGVLFQGSLWRPAVSAAAINWDLFGTTFVTALATELGAAAEEKPWPDFNEEELSGLVEQYSSSEWVEYR